MPEIVPITAEFVAAYRQARLAALMDVPSAFGSTYTREVLLSAEDWLQRCEYLDGKQRVGFIALGADQPAGLIACFLDEEAPSVAQVISIWVASPFRRAGLGSRLLGTVRAWATSRGATTLRLMVTSSNQAALAFYQRYGFTMTGRTEPYPNDPRLVELEMVHSIIA